MIEAARGRKIVIEGKLPVLRECRAAAGRESALGGGLIAPAAPTSSADTHACPTMARESLERICSGQGARAAVAEKRHLAVALRRRGVVMLYGSAILSVVREIPSSRTAIRNIPARGAQLQAETAPRRSHDEAAFGEHCLRWRAVRCRPQA